MFTNCATLQIPVVGGRLLLVAEYWWLTQLLVCRKLSLDKKKIFFANTEKVTIHNNNFANDNLVGGDYA